MKKVLIVSFSVIAVLVIWYWYPHQEIDFNSAVAEYLPDPVWLQLGWEERRFVIANYE